MIELEQTAGGVLLPVQAQPRARKNAVVGVHAARLKVAVTQAPEKGTANDALLTVLAQALGLRRSQLSVVSGPTSSQKKILITDTTPEALRARINACLDAVQK